MNGKVLCPRGGREHKALKISQFKFGFKDDREFIEYTENGSKNLSGSYKDKSGNKIVKHFADSYQNASYSHKVQYIRLPPMGVIGTWPDFLKGR